MKGKVTKVKKLKEEYEELEEQLKKWPWRSSWKKEYEQGDPVYAKILEDAKKEFPAVKNIKDYENLWHSTYERKEKVRSEWREIVMEVVDNKDVEVMKQMIAEGTWNIPIL